MVIQMQDAQYNNGNAIAFGDGSTGRGWTAINNSGRYEFRSVTAVAGSVITVDQNLSFTYTRAAPSAGVGASENGNRRFQVIRVPQFSSLTLPGGTLSPPAWNGESGGVWVIDVAGNLAMNNTTINATALGFRGGGGIPNANVAGSVNYANTATVDITTQPATAACPAIAAYSDNAPGAAGGSLNNNPGSFKGEGIAGTPRYVRLDAATGSNLFFSWGATDTGASGYSAGRDLARGAPGNAGGGGTQHNGGGGGGGGSNVGQGGLGGGTFAFYSSTNTGGCVAFAGGNPNPFFACGGDGARSMGGLGGGTLASSIDTLILGGGGGAGDSNNACDNPTIQQAAGGHGGGTIFLRAGTTTGNGNLFANGGNGFPGGRDAAGGGGAGGTVVVLTGTASPALAVQVNGGQGGNTARNGTGGVAGTTVLRGGETQGPGGGGGGGSVVRSSNVTLPAPQFTGGASGATFPSASVAVFNTYGSGSGGDNAATTPFIPTSPSFAASCLPQLAVSKATTTPLLAIPAATTATYVITLTNTGTGGAAGVAVTDTLPTPFATNSTSATVTSVAVAGPSPAPITGTTVPVIGTPGGTVANAFVVLPGSSLTLTFVVNLGTATFGIYQNTATVGFSDPFRTATSVIASPGGTYANGSTPIGGSNYASGSSTAEDIRLYSGTTSLTISKTNGVTALTAGQTTSYTITVANLGGTAAPGTVLVDPAAPGLNCTTVTCTSTAANMCPASPSIAALQSTGLQISPSFPANSTASFVVTCGVTATGQ